MPCRLLNLLSHIIVTVQIKYISDEIESVLIILDIGIEPGKVEAICEIIFIDFAEVFIASRRDELCTDLSASAGFLRHQSNKTRAKLIVKAITDNAAKPNQNLRLYASNEPTTTGILQQEIALADRIYPLHSFCSGEPSQ